MTRVPSILITGANRGIGLELVRQFDAAGWRIFACCRFPAQADVLRGLAGSSGGRITLHAVDVADHASIDMLAREIGPVPIDVLLNNAGVLDGPNGSKRPYAPGQTAQRLDSLDADDWMQVLRVNVMGPARMVEMFAGNVAASERRVIGILTSITGSLANNTTGGIYHYRTSKTAVNMLVRNVAAEFAGRGITAVALHPGWARTDMGGANAPVGVEESGSGLCRVITGLTGADSGRCLTWQGDELPW